MSEQNLREAIKNYKEYQRMMEELEGEMEAVKDTIKAELAARGVDELTAGEYKVTWKPVTTTRIDAKAFRQAFPEVAQAFAKTTTCRRFTIV